LALCRSLDDEVADAAADKWHKAAAAYREHLRRIHGSLPLGVRQLLRHATLHDASLLTLNRGKVRGKANLFLTFRLAGGGGRTSVQLRYETVEKVKAIFHQPDASHEAELYALYDEFDVTTDHKLTHSILMTGNIELQISFVNLHFTLFTDTLAPGRGEPGLKDRLAEVVGS
jgi:hypothetical protein